ncbi:hypothetical protein KM043_006478 [Ampulex compressa]|nr:hypothetical protein KM043_006478 [Ampulex compressa]
MRSPKAREPFPDKHRRLSTAGTRRSNIAQLRNRVTPIYAEERCWDSGAESSQRHLDKYRHLETSIGDDEGRWSPLKESVSSIRGKYANEGILSGRQRELSHLVGERNNSCDRTGISQLESNVGQQRQDMLASALLEILPTSSHEMYLFAAMARKLARGATNLANVARCSPSRSKVRPSSFAFPTSSLRFTISHFGARLNELALPTRKTRDTLRAADATY